MEVFRISADLHSRALTSSGRANRWNKYGQNVIYTGFSRSLVTLESIVHKNSIKTTAIYKVLVISVPDNEIFVKQIPISDLPANWRTLAAYSILQDIGSTWFEGKETLLLKVPSAIIPFEYIYIINIEHPDFPGNIRLVRIEDYFFDGRLL